ncbi:MULTISPECIES: hypothetical protein [Streptomyces]|uniref:hypothetical protein n=1 Tax=Streptomyces tendae TaxID=1932 RepID=UPI003822472D
MTPPAVVSQTALTLAVEGGDAEAHRVRTVLLHPVSGTLSVDEHVRVRCSAPTGWTALGDVLVGPGSGARGAARLAGSCPGALVVAVHRGTRCWLRSGRAGPVLLFEARGPGSLHGKWDRLASLAHSCLVAGLPLADLGPTALLLGCAGAGPDY